MEGIVILLKVHGVDHHGHPHYMRWAARDAERIREGNLHGAELFLSGFDDRNDDAARLPLTDEQSRRGSGVRQPKWWHRCDTHRATKQNGS